MDHGSEFPVFNLAIFHIFGIMPTFNNHAKSSEHDNITNKQLKLITVSRK